MINKQPGLGWFREALRRMVRLTLAVGIVFLPLIATITAQAQEFSVIYNFSSAGGGEAPESGLIADSAGNFYGTTAAGGADGYGTVYELPATGGETVLYSFTGGSDGGVPDTGLLRDASGNLYGVASIGGNLTGVCISLGGCGVVFKVNPVGKETVLYTFTGGSDGSLPESALIRDSAGNLYGTTLAGGNYSGPCSSLGCGVIFKLSKPGQETVLYAFTGESDGYEPVGSLTRDAAGDLFGTAAFGGVYGYGTVFELSSSGRETTLYSFTGGSDGANPFSLIQDGAGNLYGVTAVGGNFGCGFGQGCGVVFKVDGSGNETVLYSFAGGADGSFPGGGIVRTSGGALYGTTLEGGDEGYGTLFGLSPAGKETVLHSFSSTDGQNPAGNLLAYKGFLYGTAQAGGSGLFGVVYKLFLP